MAIKPQANERKTMADSISTEDINRLSEQLKPRFSSGGNFASIVVAKLCPVFKMHDDYDEHIMEHIVKRVQLIRTMDGNWKYM